MNRVHRIGQEHEVHITFMVAKNTVEERIMAVNAKLKEEEEQKKKGKKNGAAEDDEHEDAKAGSDDSA